MKKNITIALLFVSLPLCFGLGVLKGFNKASEDELYIQATKGAVKNVIGYVYEQTKINKQLPDSIPMDSLSFAGAELVYIKASDGETFSISVIPPESDIYYSLLGLEGKYERLDRLTNLNELYFNDVMLKVLNESK